MPTIKQEFDSISAVAAFARNNDRHAACNNSSETNLATEDWDLGIGYEGAVKMASKGGYWPEGAADMMESHTDMATLKSEGRVPTFDYDVTGHVLDVGEFLSGSPECFISEGDEDVERKPVISFGVQVGRSGMVDARSVVYRGAAILSIIDDLENQGYRVEVWAIWAQSPRGGYGTDFRVLAKAAEDQWSPHSIAFALCHPCMNRRLLWRVAETNPLLADLTREGYSTGVSFGSETAKDFNVFFKWQTEDYYSAESALRDVQREVKNQLEGSK